MENVENEDRLRKTHHTQRGQSSSTPAEYGFSGRQGQSYQVFQFLKEKAVIWVYVKTSNF